MVSGLDVNTIQRHSGENTSLNAPFNLALGASDTVEHLLLLRRAMAAHPEIAICVYGFFDFQLTEQPMPKMSGNGTLAYYLEPGVAAQYYKLSGLSKRLFPLYGKFPYLMERSTVFEKVELARRRLSEIGMPHARTNQFGRASDFSLLEASSPSQFDATCREIVDNKVGLSKPVKALITLMRSQGKRIVVVEMPMPERHRHLFYDRPAWADYRNYLCHAVLEMGAEYVQADDWISKRGQFWGSIAHERHWSKGFQRNDSE